MTTVLTIMTFILIAAVVLPLLLFLLFMAANALGLSFADRILGVAVHATIIELAIGSVVNVVGGCALVPLAIWGSLSLPETAYRLLSLILAPVGMWRIWRGVMIWMPGNRTPPASDRAEKPAKR